MNTPKTRKRNQRLAGISRVLSRDKQQPNGAFKLYILDDRVAAALGRLMSVWVLTEDYMTRVMKTLIGTPHLEVSEAIFHALIAQNARIPVMRALLENTSANASKTEIYDEILDEFQNLNSIRNKYAHGYWSTHQATGVVYVSPNRQSFEAAHMEREPVSADDLLAIIKRCHDLIGKVAQSDEFAPPPYTSPDTPQQQ